MTLLLRAIVARADATAARANEPSLRVVAAARVAAVATAHDEKAVRATRAALLEHHRVAQAVFDRVPCLPARFGAVFPDERALGIQLAEREDELASALARIGSRCEVAITLAWRDRGEARVGGASSGRAYLERSVDRERAARERARRAEDLVACLLAELPVEPAFVRHETCPRASVAVSMAALVTRDALAALRPRIERLGSTLPDVTTIVQGPWAPYSFAVTP